jgi:hypothetical protein
MCPNAGNYINKENNSFSVKTILKIFFATNKFFSAESHYLTAHNNAKTQRYSFPPREFFQFIIIQWHLFAIHIFIIVVCEQDFMQISWHIFNWIVAIASSVHFFDFFGQATKEKVAWMPVLWLNSVAD